MQAIQQASLVFLLREDKNKKEILLAQKKRGYAKGKWLGVGGKLEPYEYILDCAIRECQEEISVTPLNLEHIATLDFIFPTKRSWSQQVFAYATKTWHGKPKESEEMSPKWFEHDALPYDTMWSDATHWMPQILAGEKLYAEFYFDDNLEVSHQDVVVGKARASSQGSKQSHHQASNQANSQPSTNPKAEGGQNG